MKLIAIGRTSRVIEHGAGRVAKVLNEGVPDHWADAEAAFTAEVRRAGAAAPEVIDLITVEGRPAIVFERIVGRSLWQAMLDEPEHVDELVQVLVSVQEQVQRIGPIAKVPALVDRMLAKSRDVESLSVHDVTRAHELLAEQPRGAALLHGDLHPGNVLLGADGPVVIDWFDASIGHPDADRARTAMLLEPSGATDLRHLPGASPALIDAIAARYRELASPPGLADPWSRLVAVTRLAERTDLDTAGLAAIWDGGTGG